MCQTQEERLGQEEVAPAGVGPGRLLGGTGRRFSQER